MQVVYDASGSASQIAGGNRLTTNMQIAGKLAEADLSGVRKEARKKTHSPALRLQVPKLVFRCLALLMALASIVAVALVAVLSFGFYSVAMLLGKVRPLREGYQFFSRAYDRFIDRLGQEILRDPRDAPALRLMVSVTFTVVPIFVIQLILGRLQLLLAIAFYLSLYGVKFERIVRMFSAKHL